MTCYFAFSSVPTVLQFLSICSCLTHQHVINSQLRHQVRPKGIHGIHSIGESIRGSINDAVDHAAHDSTGEAKNQAITNKGQVEMRQGEAVVDKNSSTSTDTTGMKIQ